MPRIEDAWVSSAEAGAVFDAVEAAGGGAWFVGGCVRDALLARPVADIDIATDLTPNETTQAAERAGLTAIPTGFDHGTVTLLSGERAVEVTTLRRDVSTDGRRATVAYTRDILEDAQRRDLTLNALYARRDGTVLDPLGLGVEDARAGRIRFIGDPERRIAEDRLRMLRFFRFQASHGDPALGLDAEAMAAIRKNASTLTEVSRERIGHEISAGFFSRKRPINAASSFSVLG